MNTLRRLLHWPLRSRDERWERPATHDEIGALCGLVREDDPTGEDAE